jgi:hypothetical protein
MNTSISWTEFGRLAVEDVWPEVAFAWVFAVVGIAALWLA